jgi:hypothetical protein
MRRWGNGEKKKFMNLLVSPDHPIPPSMFACDLEVIR